MRRLRGNSRGLSEIVGTLMLVLIVIGAAVAFAAFVATYEKQLLAQEAAAHDRSLEALRILSVLPVNQTGGSPAYDKTLNFTVASETINPSVITGMLVDNLPIVRFGVENSSGPCLPPVTPLGNYTIPPFADVTFCLNATQGYPRSGVALGYPAISLDADLEISLYTALGNDFVTTFLPPTALATVSIITIETGTTVNNVPVLDGSDSFQQGTNSTITSWLWVVSPNSTADSAAWSGTCSGLFSGEDVELGSGGCQFVATQAYSITLEVTNDDGLVSFQTIDYTFEPAL